MYEFKKGNTALLSKPQTTATAVVEKIKTPDPVKAVKADGFKNCDFEDWEIAFLENAPEIQTLLPLSFCHLCKKQCGKYTGRFNLDDPLDVYNPRYCDSFELFDHPRARLDYEVLRIGYGLEG